MSQKHFKGESVCLLAKLRTGGTTHKLREPIPTLKKCLVLSNLMHQGCTFVTVVHISLQLSLNRKLPRKIAFERRTHGRKPLMRGCCFPARLQRYHLLRHRNVQFFKFTFIAIELLSHTFQTGSNGNQIKSIFLHSLQRFPLASISHRNFFIQCVHKLRHCKAIEQSQTSFGHRCQFRF